MTTATMQQGNRAPARPITRPQQGWQNGAPNGAPANSRGEPRGSAQAPSRPSQSATSQPARPPLARPAAAPQSPPPSQPPQAADAERPPAPILYQTYFKSDGGRTYAAQVKRAANGRPFLVLTAGRRDPQSDEVKKSFVYVFSGDFPAFFDMLMDAADYIKTGKPPAGKAQPSQ